MGMKFTPEQQRVIELHNSNILVSAAAGSGKTAVLVERIIRMICDGEHPADIDRLLIVTFTNAAAAEMRERIAAGIIARLEADPGNEHIQKQSALLHNAQITTIDSFSLFLIRNHFNEIGLDPDFRVADEGEIKLLQQEVLAQLLEDAYAGNFVPEEALTSREGYGNEGTVPEMEAPEQFHACVEYFCPGGRESVLEQHILNLSRYAGSFPWPAEWLEERKNDYAAGDMEALVHSDYGQYLTERVNRTVEGCLEKLREVKRLCELPDGPYMYGELTEAEIEQLERLTSCKDLEEQAAKVPTVTFGRLPSKKDDSVDPAKRELAKAIRNSVKDTLSDLSESYFKTPLELAVEQGKACREPLRMLLDLVLEFDRRLLAAKQERHLIDFSDMEHYALQILLKREKVEESDGTGTDRTETKYRIVPSDVAMEYRQYFQEILIDEYQDSNLVQEYLLSAISGEEEGRYNRFMVGDVKQSIYKFRLARPELFLEKYDTYQETGDLCRIDLAKNFRSRIQVVDAVNDVFSRIMSREIGGIAYDDKAALYPGANYPAAEDPAYGSEALLIRKPEKGEREESGIGEQHAEGAGVLVDYDNVRQLEALAIAARIKQLKGSLQVMEKSTGELRPVRYSDMVILLRTTSGWDEEFKKILEQQGIPVYITSKTGYFGALEVQELLQFLRVLDNPRQDIPLFGVMQSVFGGFTQEEIAQIRSGGEGHSRKRMTLYEALKEVAQSGRTVEEGEEISAGESAGEEAELSQKADTFLQRIGHYRDLTPFTSIRDLLQRILDDYDYLNYVTALPAGSKRRANVEMLLTKASAFEKTSYFGLFHFIRYMEQLEKYDVDYGEADTLDENADVVRIMSIHKSKGLEFPVVFLAGMGKKFNKQDAYGQLLLDADLGAAADEMDLNLRTKAPTLKKMAIRRRMELESMGEELRVLYVAMTRAKEVLVMTGTDRSLENKLEKWDQLSLTDGQIPYTVLSGANSFLDWVLMAKAAVPAGHMEVKQVQLTHLIGRELQRQLEKKNVKEELLKLDTKQVYDEQMKEQLDQALSYEYPYLEDTGLYTQMSVSELKKQSQIGREEENIGTERKDLSEVRLDHEHEMEPESSEAEDGKKQTETGKKGAFRGTAYHRALECLDLLAVTDQRKLEGDLLDLFQRGFLTEEAYESIFPWDIWKFLESPLGKRMKQAEKEGKLYRERQFMVGIPASEMGKGLQSEELVLIQGVIDAYIEEADGFILIDYKTDYVPKEDTQKGEELLKERYQVQLDYYGRALTQLTGKKVKEKWIYSFGLRKAIQLG